MRGCSTRRRKRWNGRPPPPNSEGDRQLAVRRAAGVRGDRQQRQAPARRFSAAVFRFVDGTTHLAAFTPTHPAADEASRAAFRVPVDDFAAVPAAAWRAVQIPDTEEDRRCTGHREVARSRGFRSMLFVAADERRRPDRPSSRHARGDRRVCRPSYSIAADLRRPGRHRDRERPAVQRDAGGAGAADRDRRHPEGDRQSSPSDAQPVFEAIAGSAKRLLGGFSAAVFRFVDGISHLAAFTPTDPAADEVFRRDISPAGRRVRPVPAGQDGSRSDPRYRRRSTHRRSGKSRAAAASAACCSCP